MAKRTVTMIYKTLQRTCRSKLAIKLVHFIFHSIDYYSIVSFVDIGGIDDNHIL